MRCPNRLSLTLAAVLAVNFACPAFAEQAVKYGGEAEFDSCAGVVETIRNNVPVFDAPRSAAKNVATLPRGIALASCDETQDGTWLGVVLIEDESVVCGTGTPVAIRQDYKGPCPSGWVRAKDTRLIAG